MTWWLQGSRSSHLECPRVSCNPERWQRPLASSLSLRSQPAAHCTWHFLQHWGPGCLSLTRCLCSPPSSASSHTMKGLRDTHMSHYCGPRVQSLCTPSAILCPLLFCAPGTMGRARVVLGPCFRVGLECIWVPACLNLLPARCLCASLVLPPPEAPPETAEAAGARAVFPSCSSRGRRRSAEKLRCSPAAGGGRTRDSARPRWAGCEPSAVSKGFISSGKGN